MTRAVARRVGYVAVAEALDPLLEEPDEPEDEDPDDEEPDDPSEEPDDPPGLGEL